MNLESRPQRAPGVLQQEVSGTTVLLKPDNGQYFSLEEVAGRVWELTDGQRTVSEMVQVLVSEYEAEPAEIEADVLQLLGELCDEKLVTQAA